MNNHITEKAKARQSLLAFREVQQQQKRREETKHADDDAKDDDGAKRASDGASPVGKRPKGIGK